MNVLIISQCNKRALIETRRILDQFAERKGDTTWQTAITLEGLNTLRMLLRKTAKRNTAVACHWIKGKNRTELVWIVGNISKFNIDGSVPTNITTRDILRTQDENQWRTIADISIIAGIAGLFHDFGKANKLFQEKLKKNAKKEAKLFEPYRHEWVSLRLFQAFVDGRLDATWLENLKNINEADEEIILEKLIKDKPFKSFDNPFANMSKLAQAIAWVIVSHHRLLMYQEGRNNKTDEPRLENIDKWMTGIRFDPSWNSIQSINQIWDEKPLEAVWSFPNGTPIRSKLWCKKANRIAIRALARRQLMSTDWFLDRFSLHLSRLTMMLADHYYSSLEPTLEWQDKKYKAYANTDKKSKNLKQKLDEHNIGVGHNAVIIAQVLPKIRLSLPSISHHKGFKKRSTTDEFRWQDKAYDLARNIQTRTFKQGFFGINMASTGCGKTFANGKIMYGLADEKLGCRFSIALGLRTLTLQTGDALKERLRLQDDDIAVLIGSQSVKLLHDKFKNEPNNNDVLSNENEYEKIGSESLEDFFAEHEYVKYDGALDDGRLSHWISQSPKVHKLLSAPILVSTIDHLIPATEGQRGGKQIAPMLRLLTSDLVLDEPDDFDLNDLPALCRLVNWAGMLGSRVLLSSATLPPALIEALFEAYRAGRVIYQQAVGENNIPKEVCCAWFDENGVSQSDHGSAESFKVAHQIFVTKRVEFLEKKDPIRKAIMIDFSNQEKKTKENAIELMAKSIFQKIFEFHDSHHEYNNTINKRVSIGLVRIANIGRLVEISKKIVSYNVPENFHIHYCVYHSQFPLAIRSYIEKNLDDVLKRHQPEKIWELDLIKSRIENSVKENHLFVILASPVAEVGRDHDYDWGIVEPSSMRSIIQLAGRIQRHRNKLQSQPNIAILSKNYKALIGESLAYYRPGFETKACNLTTKDLMSIINFEKIAHITASSRIQEKEVLSCKDSFIDLEHYQLREQLFNIKYNASFWWASNADWCYELQRNTPFRKSMPSELFYLYSEDEYAEPSFFMLDNQYKPKRIGDSKFEYINLDDSISHKNISYWFNFDYTEIIKEIAEHFNISFPEACLKFGEVTLPELDGLWQYEPHFGVYKQ